MSTPAMNLNNSPAMCGEVPMPGEAMLILPGLALAYFMNSGTVLAGNAGLTTITYGFTTEPGDGREVAGQSGNSGFRRASG